MNKSCFFSCYIISQTSLGLQCAQILMSEGHKLLGIISNHHETGTWAQQKSIPIIPTIAEFQELNPNKKFDYLFSIVNTKILSNSILQLPRFCAINYHDSLLPKYAGVNATSWAILNNEKIHGISWHKMEEAIDHGCILKQSTFPVKEDDTALSLNLECYVHALESFKKLIKDLPKDSDTTIPLGIEQDIRNRTYFARYQKPPNLGFIFLDDSAQNIERQFRALYFGEYQNTLTSFKVLIDDHIFIPTELKILSTQSDTEAGTIISITDENIQVSTTTQDIILTSFKTTYGQPITIQEIKQLTFLDSKLSNRLQRLSTKTLEELHKLSCDLHYSEAFWANSILNSTPATLPFMHQTFNIDGKKNQKIKKKYTQIIIPTKQLLLHSERYNNIHDVMERNYSFTNVLLDAFIIYLNHIGNVSPFSLGFVSSFLQNLPKGLQLFFPRYVSLTFSIPANITISDLMSHIQNQVRAAEKNKAYFNDLLVRSPNIASSYTALPIVIKIEDEFQAKDKEIIKEDTKFDDALIFSINKTNKTCILEIEETLATCYLNDAARILIKHLPKHLEILIKQILENPDQTIDTLSLLTEQEKHQLLIEWNDTKHEYLEAHNKTITQLFEEQVERTPDNIAVVYEDQALTYNQLNEKANQLAHYLRSLGVVPDTLVAIAVERSLEMIIGLLGILKAGGAYVPLDPDYPEERIKFMLDDTGASIILTDTKVIDKLPATFAQCICLNEEWSNISTLSSANLVSVTLPHNLAYVIYTSGSTGNPKGVMVGHGSLMKSTQARLNYYTSPLTNFLLLSSIAFDSSIAGIFWSLVKGTYIILPKIKNNIDAHSIFEQMQKYQINHLLCVPSFYKTLLMLQEEHQNIQFFLAITVAGEYCDDLLIDHHHKYFSCTSLFNEYGPTEASVWSSAVCLHDAKTQSRSNQTSIGRPISNTQIYILDTYMNPVPIGIAGEIYIGGAGLARGYLNRADLTAEKFVPNPFVTQNDGTESKTQEYLRLYRSGDLARYLPDGNIEFLGRIDDQVKIRGFRIELGEIESTLNNHLDVTQAVVVAREDEPDHKQLVAYVVPGEKVRSSLEQSLLLTSSAKEEFAMLSEESIPSLTDNLRNHLVRSLPDYMIPAFFVYLDKIPLTSNGKIDRKALPAPDLSLRQVSDEYVAPTSQVELELSSIWSEVLRIEKIGIYDNFFKLGGHSLLATQVISRIRHLYNIDIPLRSIFDHSTISALGQEIEQLSKANSLSLIPPIIVQDRPDSIPLSFAQQRLWFLDQLLPEVALYNIPLALKLTGSLNIEVLEKAFNALIIRHESLRTIFPATGGEAHQTILPHLVINLTEHLIDLSDGVKEAKRLGKKMGQQKQQKRSLESLAFEEANISFNLSTGPLIRVKLIVLSQEEHVLLVTFHHIISDGWSMDIFFKEISHLYNEYLKGEEAGSTLPDLPVQYADFTLWQRGWLQGEALEQQLAYWKKQLSDIPELLEIKTDKPRPKELTYKGDSLLFSFSKDIKDKLNKLSQQNGSSLFMTLLAVFQVLLYRYTGERNIVVGSPIANRHYKETESLIGFFVNTLALKTTFARNETFIDVLTQVRKTTLDAYQHQDVPFEQIVDHLDVTREFNRNPIFQVMFTIESGLNTAVEGQPFALQGIQANPVISSSYSVAKVDLTLSVYEHEEGIELGFQYATDLFDEDTIKGFARHFEKLTKEIIKDASTSIDTLSLLTEPEKHQMLIEWNDTTTPYPDNKTIHQLFEEQVERTPDNVAVVYEDQALTYSQLNEKANQLAHYLRSLGIGPDTLVAIAVERSLEMMIGLLGILKAGGAYVPLDPDYPEERIKFMLDDTGASVLITQGYLQDKLKETLVAYKGVIVVIDKEWNNISTLSSANLVSITLPNHLAYVIYTSGSTGNPKGVMVGHGNLSYYLNYSKKTYSTQKDEATLLHSSIAFDMSITSLYVPLVTGSMIYILATSSPSNSLEEISQELDKINFLKLTPTHLRALKNQSTSWNVSNKARCLIVGGENLQTNDISFWLEALPNTVIFNEYGPTETTVGCCTFKIAQLDDLSQISIPIGRPISNTQIYILDTYMNPVPIGIAGEIYIGGAGLARGYLNRADLTAEKFVPNPFVTQNDGAESKTQEYLRLYRSGDLARYLPDGNIEFLGRIDDQVKIRGFRIELGEIESTLNNHLDVTQAVVVAREDEPGHKQLVAYVVPGEFTPSNTELRDFLAEKLPDYMIPSFFVYLDQIPLTQNGKVDKKSLPVPNLSLRQVGDEYTAPQTTMEQGISAIWSEVLRREHIGIYDNFFRIGGDSIISIQLVAKARTKGIHFTVKDVFNCPTIATLSLVAKTEENTLTIKPEQGKLGGEVSLLPIQKWFFESNHVFPNHWNQSFIVKVPNLDISKLQLSINKLVQHHDSFTLRYKRDKGASNVYTQYYDTSAEVEEVKKLDIRTLEEKEDSKEFTTRLQGILTSWQSKFNLEQGPIYSIGYIYGYGDGSSRIHFALHHLIVDAVSWRILTEDLMDIYNQEDVHLAPNMSKGSSYRQWVDALKQYGNNNESEREYWNNVLSDYDNNNLLALVPHENTNHNSGFSLSSKQTKQLLQQSNRAYNTQVNDILLTSLGYALSEAINSKVNHIVLEGHGREEIDNSIDVTRALGWFTTMYPVRLEIKGNIGDSLKWTKETLRQVPNKGIDYGALIGYNLESSRLQLQQHVLPKISFNYLGQFNRDGRQLENQSLWEIVDENSGESVHFDNQDHNIISINGLIINDSLRFSIESKLDYSTTTKLAEIFKQKLIDTITHCIGKATEYTMSDFNDFEPYVVFNEAIQGSTLFILPPGEGGAESYFNNIVPQLSGKKLVLFNNYLLYLEQKLGSDNVNHVTYENLANDYICYIKSIQPQGPYNLLGWSFGGVLAFEIARQLTEQDCTVENIILIDSLFDYKTAVLQTDTQLSESSSINYKYSPLLNSKMPHTNIILFKTLRVAPSLIPSAHNDFKTKNIYKIFKHYVEESWANYLDVILKDKKFILRSMNHDHYSWIHSISQIQEICKTVTALNK